jgi:glycerol uptake facilitator-like aquaporin
MNLPRKFAAEFIGTAFLLAIVVGSGIMGVKLSQGNDAVALLGNTIATSSGLVFLILSFGAVSGAHFNPIVTILERLSFKETAIYLLAQICGAVFGVGLANVMFELPILFAATKIRTGYAQYLSEFVATFGLIMVIKLGSKFHTKYLPFTVAAYITAAYWFTSSTSFANPAVTIARSLSDTFAGIRPVDIIPFIIAQLLGGLTASFIFGWLVKPQRIEETK